MKSIKIAPDLDEIQVEGNTITTEFNGVGIKYTNDNVILFKEYVSQSVMQTAIGMSSKSWQVKDRLDEFFRGESIFETTEL